MEVLIRKSPIMVHFPLPFLITGGYDWDSVALEVSQTIKLATIHGLAHDPCEVPTIIDTCAMPMVLVRYIDTRVHAFSMSNHIRCFIRHLSRHRYNSV